MKSEATFEVRIGRRGLVVLSLIVTLVLTFLLLPSRIQAQKTQESYKDKFKIASETGGVAIAVSADGKFVYVAGPGGILVSNDFGKTGSWVQTAVLK
jgi:DNA-binding beta-propeller fold protein YncE